MRDSALLLGIWGFDRGSAQEIVHADIVKIRQLHQYVNGVVQNADLILRVGVLGYVEDTGKIALTKIVIFP